MAKKLYRVRINSIVTWQKSNYERKTNDVYLIVAKNKSQAYKKAFRYLTYQRKKLEENIIGISHCNAFETSLEKIEKELKMYGCSWVL